jgi:hypothetical protein
LATDPHPHDTHAIRIVQLYSAPEAPATPPHLTYRNGPLISAVEVFTVFWGGAWEQPPQNGLVGQINQFFDFVLTSALIDQLAEYSVAAHTISHGRRTGTLTLTTPAPGQSVSDTTIQQTLQQQISKKALPPATPNTLYFVYLPPGVRVVLGGSASCQAFCGYHDAIAGNTFYGVMPYPGCKGCTGTLALFDALTSTSSHELCEAITDPVPGQGWYDDTNGEIGDICAWQTKKLGQYTVQLEWSNSKNACA